MGIVVGRQAHRRNPPMTGERRMTLRQPALRCDRGRLQAELAQDVLVVLAERGRRRVDAGAAMGEGEGGHRHGEPTLDAVGDGVNPPPTTPYQGLDHFGLLVSGIDAVVAELKAKGAEFSREPTTVRPGVRVAFLRSPQGVSIELLDRNAA